MKPDSPASATVLVVEDDRALADAYATHLRGRYSVRVAYDGDEAIARLDSSVDVVLLDRRLPDHSGDQILSAIRESGYDCRVALVTAIEPDFDIIAMDCDDYLVKPVGEDELVETIERLLIVGEFDNGLRELFARMSTAAALECQKTPTELDRSDEYRELRDRIDDLESRMEELSAALPPDHLFGVALDHTPRNARGRS